MEKIVIAMLGLMVTSCMSFNDKGMRPIVQSIQSQMPQIHLEKEFAIVMGGSLFTLFDVVTLNSADMSDLDHVEVAVYNVSNEGSLLDFDDLNFAATLAARDDRLHWETIVRVREAGEQVWVMVGMDLQRQSLEAVAVFVLEHNELVLISVDGELNEMLRFAMQPAADRRHALRKGKHRT